eukprot:501606-Rhodomonas_salina.3
MRPEPRASLIAINGTRHVPQVEVSGSKGLQKTQRRLRSAVRARFKDVPSCSFVAPGSSQGSYPFQSPGAVASFSRAAASTPLRRDGRGRAREGWGCTRHGGTRKAGVAGWGE